jgi:hypothetical protein
MYAIGVGRMEFIEAPPFTRNLANYFADEDYLRLQRRLIEFPEAGDLMPGTGGFRKLRWADSRRGKGSRGGLRIIYFYFVADRQIWLMTLYDKSEASDLTPKQKEILKDTLGTELRARRAKLSNDKTKRSRQ